MNSWASSFLDEDNDAMGDPEYFFIRMTAQSQQPITEDNTVKFNAIERLINPTPPTDTDARLAALRALSGAAHKGRLDEAERRALTPDECWGHDVLKANGICPECLWPQFQCECEDAADGLE